ncbi:Helix-turn-helix domain-containing protein [Micromonospora phaseoli]|uniref:Helix-turn-helix domain-containing protein n=1 Tax=Micromonospora phaseoli TaxID=1144548 RepID=A0A1H7B4R6_9ACTN|nr:helix-turn-helix transcriptional regulator [Micromonospora phaseoli]PZV95205.1 helix-turn-helix protein [Micromonospora phaseoli]GIJ79025.1 transcriptional regulator [Micromonospora phaseoli]SEJ72771.1 Helix-turn-helix domain-containing protein [Micromonospora phaseoli]
MPTTALGAFLTARRARLTPGDVGLVSSGTRRVAGLRREEVAVLAGVSVDYYTRLEQGRERNPSTSVLAAVARALDLGPDAHDHLFRLAGLSPGGARTPARPQVGQRLRELLDAWPDTPAVVIDRRLNLLAGNALADAFYADFAEADNLVRMTFLDPAGATFFADWRRAAETCVANLRLALGHDPHDRQARELVDEVGTASPEFRRLWERHDVQGKTHEAKTFRHGAVGELTLSYHAFDVRDAPGQQLIVYRAEPHSRSAEALRLLGTLAASSWLR